jgi:hypothetical protein
MKSEEWLRKRIKVLKEQEESYRKAELIHTAQIFRYQRKVLEEVLE